MSTNIVRNEESAEKIEPKIKGSIKTIRTGLDTKECFGFITREDGGKDIFLDITSLSSFDPKAIDLPALIEEFSKLSKGNLVMFNTKQGRNKDSEVACDLILDNSSKTSKIVGGVNELVSNTLSKTTDLEKAQGLVTSDSQAPSSKSEDWKDEMPTSIDLTQLKDGENIEKIKPQIKGSIKTIKTGLYSNINECFGIVARDDGGKDVLFYPTSLSSFNPDDKSPEHALALVEEFSKLSNNTRIAFTIKQGKKTEYASNITIDSSGETN